MGIEIERKYLLNSIPDGSVKFAEITQGYLSTDKDRTVRIRLYTYESGIKAAYICVKGIINGSSFSRYEYEYPIPYTDGKNMIEMCIKPIINKVRYQWRKENNEFEIDEFLGELDGLILAEIELNSEEDRFDLPEWATNEVTNDSKYTNAGIVEMLNAQGVK